jgi:tRNA (guanosine-2'-O-)-methyltransferase
MEAREHYNILKGYLTDHKSQLFEEKLAARTRHLTILMEDIFQPHNASAVIRTAECFGVQDLHVVERRNEFAPARHITRGALKWLTMHKYRSESNASLEAVKHLREKNYRIVVTTPGLKAHTPESLPLAAKTVIIIGTEKEGVSRELLENADDLLNIPMAGFTESLNLSVATGIIVRSLTERLRQSTDILWHLSEDEKDELRLTWAKSCIAECDAILEREMQGR